MPRSLPNPTWVGGVRSFLCVIASLGLFDVALADVVKARKDGVKVFAEANSATRVLKTLKKDEVVNTRHRFGSFHAVDIGPNAIGYVRVLEVAKVADKEAEAFQRTLEKRVGTLPVDDGASSARARTSSSVMGIRGLAVDGDASARADVRPDMRHVRIMEERDVGSERRERIERLESLVFEEIENKEKELPKEKREDGGSFTAASLPVSEPRPPTLEERQAEAELGRAMAGRILAITPPLRDPMVSKYVNDVGAYVANAAGASDRRYFFEVVEADAANAFACPGGYVFVTTGALRAVANEAELAAILGLEIVHVNERHVLQALQGKDFTKERANEEKKDSVADARRRPEPAASEVGAFLSKQLLGPQAAGLSLLQALDAGMNVLLNKGLDAKLELEADAKGLQVAVRAGYEHDALVKFFARMRAASANDKPLPAEATHPKFLDRENALLSFLGAQPTLATTGAQGRERFLRMQKRVVAAKKETAR
jgi:hypothetical protein